MAKVDTVLPEQWFLERKSELEKEKIFLYPIGRQSDLPDHWEPLLGKSPRITTRVIIMLLAEVEFLLRDCTDNDEVQILSAYKEYLEILWVTEKKYLQHVYGRGAAVYVYRDENGNWGLAMNLR